MKRFSIIFFFFSLTVFTVTAQTTVKALRVKETNPNISAWVLSTQEQLTGQAFQQDALVTFNGYQYTVYYNATRNVTISRRKLPSGDWNEVVLSHQNTLDDSHNVISMGICQVDGTIHLAYDHHNTTLQYCRSVIGLAFTTDNDCWNAAGFGATTSQLVAGTVIPDVTYPRFIEKPDGNLLFECRYKLSGDGDSYLREYDGTTHLWTHVGRYVQGMDASPNACAYINRMDYDDLGRLHVSWCWRDDYGGGSNHDIYYGYSEDHGRTWKDTYGAVVASTENIAPTDDRTSGACMRQGLSSLKIETIPYYKGYINQETQATDSKGRVHIVNSYMVDGTETNWTTARTKAVLHHRFRDTDGTWHHNLIRNNGDSVNSYCRVQLIIDPADNAIVVANGAEIYAATSANKYEDWGLLSDADNDRFCSEPQIDRNAISDGILSFVYLGRDHKIAVIDYLLDNPDTLNGTGLQADYFSDASFSVSNGSLCGTLPGSPIPANTTSVRWSGTLETHFAEKHTLFLTTSASSVVYINGLRVLETGAVSGLKTFSISLQAINSHKNNLVIESKATPSDSLSLGWSSDRTARCIIPACHFYPEKQNDTDLALEWPTLTTKSSLPIVLLDDTLMNLTDAKKKRIVFDEVNPSGDYSIEAAVTIHSATGRGLDLDIRNGGATGFRIAMNQDSLLWMAPLSDSYVINQTNNTEKQVLRFAVEGANVHLFQDELFICTIPLQVIYDLDSTGLAETSFSRSIAVTDSANLIGNPQFLDDANNAAPSGWLSEIAMGGGTQPRVQVNNAEWPNQSVFTFRFDNDASYGTWFAYPVMLKPDTWYEYAWDNVHWGTNTGSYLVVASTSPSGSSGVVAGQSNTIPADRYAIETKFFRFKTDSASGTDSVQYYLTFQKSTAMSTTGVSNLSLTARSLHGLQIGKNYCDGTVSFTIDHLTYDPSGAFAPSTEVSVTKPSQISGILVYSNNQTLYLDNLPGYALVSVYDIAGRRCFSQQITGSHLTVSMAKGIYMIRVETDNMRWIGKMGVR